MEEGDCTKPGTCGWDLACHEDWHASLTQRANPDHLCKDISFFLAGTEREEMGGPMGREDAQQVSGLWWDFPAGQEIAPHFLGWVDHSCAFGGVDLTHVLLCTEAGHGEG